MDRPHLRYIEAGNVAPTPSIAAVTAPGKALGQFGEVLSGLGEKGLQIAEKIRTDEEGGMESRFFIDVEKDMAGFQNGLLERQDFESWQGDLDTRIATHRARLDDMNLSRDARQRITRRFDEYAADKQLKIGSAVAAGKVSNSRGWDAQALKSRQEAKDWAGFDRQIDSMAGRYPAHEIAALRKERGRLEAYDTAESTFRSQPTDVDQYLKDGPQGLQERFPGLDSNSAEQLVHVGQRLSIEAKNQFWESILNRAMDEGTNSAIYSKDELQAFADKGLITAQQRAGYIAAYHAPAPPAYDDATYNRAYGAISSYEPASDPSGAVLAHLRSDLATLPQPREVIAQLHERLNERVKPAKPRVHQLAGEFTRKTETYFETGRFGDWFSYGDHDHDSRTLPRKVIAPQDYSRASSLQRGFTDAFDAWLRNQPDTLDPLKAHEMYDQLFDRMVIDQGGTVVPGGPAIIDLGSEVDRVLGLPQPGKPTPPASNKSASFAGQRLRQPGMFYRNARPTVFTGTTGDGVQQGVAIPQTVLEATFPGKDAAWFAENARVMVKTADGRQGVFPAIIAAPAPGRDQHAVLDLTEGAIRQLGGQCVYRGGKLAGVQGLGTLSFALTTAKIGTQVDLRGMPWAEAQDTWFRDKKPVSAEQVTSGLTALRLQWNEANAEDDDSTTSTTGAPPLSH